MGKTQMKVSAIMPARGRSALAAKAIISYLTQTYKNKELIIIDDDDEPAFENGFQFGGSINYYRYSGEWRNIPQKRNALCERATGDIIMHFDSDDWSSPDRMEDQVSRLVAGGGAIQVTGYHSMLFWEEPANRAWQYRGPWPTFALGTTLAYFPSWWKNNKFPEDRPTCEDNAFVKAARSVILSTNAGQLMVARAHRENTDKKELTGGCSFMPVSTDQIPKGFF